ncbi:MAG: substrate-binding domain-containing protein [Erysipelotrichaceae bacterium]|nr:substrate-binding domain-containing protein [Erysipelotrichaceae bacterium]
MAKKKKGIVKKIFLGILGVFVLAVAVLGLKIWKMSSDRNKYMGHGFKYMNGYSTTDFTGYHVYDGEKLVTLDHEASLRIENEADMPILDGAEACYPVYSALAKAVYKDIDKIEADYHTRAEEYWNARGKGDNYEMMTVYLCNGKYVSFTNTVQAYYRLINKEADLVIAARPSANQKAEAADKLEQIITVPIGREAFIFFVEEDNPIDNLTSEQIRQIYHGDITNWKQLGGKNENIVAFQRPEDSGSQVMMKWFMGDVSLKEPKKIEYIGGMGDIISKVAEYNNEKGAIGYTFKYFLTGLNQEQHVKILSVDGIEPTAESIKNGSYPATVNLVCAYLVSNQKETVRQMVDFMLSDDGQYIIEKTGYAALANREVVPFIENEIPDFTAQIYQSEDNRWKLTIYRQKTDTVIAELSDGSNFCRGNLYYYPENGNDPPYMLDSFAGYYDIGFRYDAENDTYVKEGSWGNVRIDPPRDKTVFRRIS